MATFSKTAHAKALRAKARKRLGPLKHLPVSKLTRVRYREAGSLFAAWFQRRWPDKVLRRSGMVDKFLSKFLQHLWKKNRGLCEANTVVAAIQHFRPRCRGTLKESWRLLHAWRKAEKANKATPATPLIGFGISKTLEVGGFERRAAALAVGYDGMMRGAEMASFRCSDVTFVKGKAIIKLAFTKILGYRRADSELAIVSHPLALRILRRAMRRCIRDKIPVGESLCGCSLEALRSHVMRVFKTLNMNDLGYSLHSWRRGAATTHFLKHGNLEKTMLHGRWSNAKVARDYISEATACLADTRIPKKARICLRHQLS